MAKNKSRALGMTRLKNLLGPSHLVPLDLALLVTTSLLIFTPDTVLFFHCIFMLLTFGAFFWKFPAFVARTIIWVTITILIVLDAVRRGSTQSEELIEIPLLVIILLMVFIIARQRTKSEDRLLEAHEQIVRSERSLAIAELAAGVAHDLRNPLGAIKNSVYYLNKKLGGSPEAQADQRIGQFFSIIDEEVDRSNRRVSDLISLARPNPPTLAPVDLTSAVESSLSALNWGNKGIDIIKEFTQESLVILADSEQLEHVIYNLVANAIEATPNGGSLTVTTQSVDGFALTSFSDTGEGVGEDIVGSIFDPLFTTKPDKGTGLGLAICRKILSSHSGSIEVTSNTGPGTTVTVSLPLAANHAEIGQSTESHLVSTVGCRSSEKLSNQIYVLEFSRSK